jgi:hypothetical protein
VCSPGIPEPKTTIATAISPTLSSILVASIASGLLSVDVEVGEDQIFNTACHHTSGIGEWNKITLVYVIYVTECSKGKSSCRVWRRRASGVTLTSETRVFPSSEILTSKVTVGLRYALLRISFPQFFHINSLSTN